MCQKSKKTRKTSRDVIGAKMLTGNRASTPLPMRNMCSLQIDMGFLYKITTAKLNVNVNVQVPCISTRKTLRFLKQTCMVGPKTWMLQFCSISFMLFNSFKSLLQCFILVFGHFGNHGFI